ncbi:MAG TPA: TlpA disulfide reductase family protein [Stellaceae bacterium]|jgi:thiol-disulfide isomerase/thioredoxin|nr:TlpA disulfide reductase family protein [Stellaceae bacterium]
MARPSFRLTSATIAAAVALVLVALGLEYGPQFFSARTVLQEPVEAADGLELTLFDRPRPMPEIRFADDQDHERTLEDFRGRVVLLNIWATWCAPCRKEMPALDRLQARLGGDEFVVIPLSVDRDGAAAVRRFYQEVGVKKLRIYVDPSARASHALSIPGVPTTLLIDREGREVARKMGEAEWDGPKMVSLVQQIIHAASDNEGAQNR